MNKAYTIQEESIRDLLTSVINPKYVGNTDNIEHIGDMLTSLSEDNVSVLITLILARKEKMPFCIGDTIKFKPNTYSSIYDKDIMKDKGLMSEDGYVYGIIKADGSWNNEAFNPYYPTMNVEMYIWKDNKVTMYDDSLKTVSLIKINPTDLPDFNSKEYLDFFNKEVKEEIDNTLNI